MTPSNPLTSNPLTSKPQTSSPLTLSALLAHPANGGLQPLGGTDASGPAGVPDLTPDDMLDDVVLAVDEAGLAARQSDALAVIITGGAPPTPWQQDALIRRVRDLGYVALALPGAVQLSDGARHLARRIGLRLLDVADPMALARAGWQLAEARDALTLDYVRRVVQSIEYPAHNLNDLLRHLASAVGHSVALLGPEGVLLEAGGTLPAEVHRAIDFTRWLDTARTPAGAAASVRTDSPSRTDLRLAFFGSDLNDRYLTALAVAAQVAMPVVAARILVDELADTNDAAVASALLREFMERRGGLDSELDQRMAERGWRTTGYHLGFRMAARGRLDPIRVLRMVQAELATLPVDSHAATSGRGVTGWLSFGVPPAQTRIENAVAMLHRVHTAVRRSFPVATGVGTVHGGAGGLIASIDSATDAAGVATARNAADGFVRADTLGLEQLLLSWADQDAFVPAARSLLAPLQARGPELLATLTSYLDHESGLAATAEAMGLHRNTVSTRITRVQELLGLDLADPETRLAVHLACRALHR